MGSFNGGGRDQGHDKRRRPKGVRRGFLKAEFLEDRVLLATAPYITSLTLNNGPQVVGGPRSFFEVGGGQELPRLPRRSSSTSRPRSRAPTSIVRFNSSARPTTRPR